MQNLFEGWRKYLIVEGRKQNAAAMIIKKVNDPHLQDLLATEILDLIIAADPTPNKKYIEWGARRMSEAAQKAEDDDHINKLKIYQKDPEGFYELDRLDPERQELVKTYTKEKRAQSGYMTNAERLQSSREIVQADLFARLRKIQWGLPIYHNAANRGLMDKDINKYKELYEWEHDVYRAEREIQEREHMKKVEQGAKETTDFLHDDDNYMIVRPRTADGSCYYGRGTKWCISATHSRNYFDQYTGEGVGFYFVMFKHLTQEDPYKKMALVFRPGEGGEPGEVFDAADDEVGVDALREAVEANVFSAALKAVMADKLKYDKGDKYAREEAVRKLRMNVETAHEAYHALEDYLDGEQWQDSEWGTPGYKGENWQKHQVQRRVLGQALKEMGLDEGSLDVAIYEDIQEHVSEIVDEQYYDILGQGSSHFEENPAGPTEAEFNALYEQHKYDYVYVSFEEYDEGRMYWDGGFSIDVTDIHEDLENADIDEVANVLVQLLDNYGVYPNDTEAWHGDVSFRFNPDYDENEGLNGFDNFLNRMDDVDLALHKILDEEEEQTKQAFVEAGMIAGVGMKSLKERFDDLELENFEIDIEERDLSIYTRLDITVPIPAHMYKGLTAGQADWTQSFRADIYKSPQLQGFDKMLEKRQTVHRDALIEHMQKTFDRVFKLWSNKLQSALPGFEREVPDRETTGLMIPDYNINLYRTSQKTQIGPSGLLTPYFFDVRIETDEEESLEEANLKLIELFLRTVDRKEMIDKIRNRLEGMVQDDAIKNIIPHFKPDEDAPEWDPIQGKVVAPGEEDYRTKKATDELSTLFENKDIAESGRYTKGTHMSRDDGSMASIMQNWRDFSSPGNGGEDMKKSVKAVIHRNGCVLLLRNERGWDLPGGHMKEGEDVTQSLQREVYEETALTISQFDDLNMIHKNKHFFSGVLERDDVSLSDEHQCHEFFNIEEIYELENLSPAYKKAIISVLSTQVLGDCPKEEDCGGY